MEERIDVAEMWFSNECHALSNMIICLENYTTVSTRAWPIEQNLMKTEVCQRDRMIKIFYLPDYIIKNKENFMSFPGFIGTKKNM